MRLRGALIAHRDVKPGNASGPSLNDVLASLGYTTSPAEFGAKHILRNGVEAFCGNAGDVWAWLRRTGQIA